MTAPQCEESRHDRDRTRCPNAARWRVTTPAWTMLMCGTHAGPWRRSIHPGSYHRPPSWHAVEAL